MSLNEDQYNLSPQQFVKRFVVVALLCSKTKLGKKIIMSIFVIALLFLLFLRTL